MRYIYAIKKKAERNKIDLRDYESEIKKILYDLDVPEENNILVKEKSFEFNFSGRMPEGRPQLMGKMLARKGVGKYGFARQKNEAYAFISYDESRAEGEQVMIELADCSTIDYDNDYRRDDMPEWVNFYSKVELSTAYISIKKAEKIFGRFYEFINEEETVVLVKVNHHRITKQRYIETNDIISYRNPIRENTCIIEHLYSAGHYQPEYIDLADIECIGEVQGNEKKLLLSKFDTNKIQISPYENQDILNIPDKNKNSEYTFTVYNVGQALATSLSENGKNPFFYFDYGIAYSYNKFTLPPKVELPLDENATILLSHVHEDHWCGYRINSQALKCRWIIPQNPSKSLAKVLAHVKLCGGSVFSYKKENINIFKIKNTNSYILTGYKLKTQRIPKDIHKTGKALYIFAEHDGKNYKIVVSGDQYYDYQDDKYLDDINLLVACHHGGKYSGAKTTQVPGPNSENEIVYSYGKNNTYNHPMHAKRYSDKGWHKEHRTPINKNYSINLKLTDNTSQISAIKKSNPTIKESVI